MSEYFRPTAESLIRTYFQAKDENRPHLMQRVFAPNATLEMIVKSATISFPATATGVEEIADTLSSKFGKTYENVYTFGLQKPADDAQLEQFSCDWLVGMSEKESKNARVGCGSYRWEFQTEAPFLVRHLTIAIDAMQTLPPETSGEVLGWVDGLPRYWCGADAMIKSAPSIQGLTPVIEYIRRPNH